MYTHDVIIPHVYIILFEIIVHIIYLLNTYYIHIPKPKHGFFGWGWWFCSVVLVQMGGLMEVQIHQPSIVIIFLQPQTPLKQKHHRNPHKMKQPPPPKKKTRKESCRTWKNPYPFLVDFYPPQSSVMAFSDSLPHFPKMPSPSETRDPPSTGDSWFPSETEQAKSSPR